MKPSLFVRRKKLNGGQSLGPLVVPGGLLGLVGALCLSLLAPLELGLAVLAAPTPALASWLGPRSVRSRRWRRTPRTGRAQASRGVAPWPAWPAPSRGLGRRRRGRRQRHADGRPVPADGPRASAVRSPRDSPRSAARRVAHGADSPLRRRSGRAGAVPAAGGPRAHRAVRCARNVLGGSPGALLSHTLT